MILKQYHPIKKSLGPWAKRETSEWEFGGGADAILSGEEWLRRKREGESEHARLMANDPMYRALHEMQQSMSAEMVRSMKSDAFKSPGPLDGGTFQEPLIYPTYGSAERNGPPGDAK